MQKVLALSGAVVAALAVCTAAFAHAHVSPPVTLAGETQVYDVAVPNEEDVPITKIELTAKDGFSLSQPVPLPGWTIDVAKTGTGDEAKVEKITWSGGSVPVGQSFVSQFLGRSDKPGKFAFAIKQTYEDGTVADWSGPESSDTPAPTIETKATLAGGGSDTLSIVALVLGALGLVAGAAALLSGRGGRELA
jgi:uncharacterized protein YcnI